MERNQKIKNRVMRRVFVLYALRQATSAQTKLFGFLVVSGFLFISVSAHNIILNALNSSHTPFEFLQYTLMAFLSTELSVQVFFIASITVAIFIMRDLSFYIKYAHQGYTPPKLVEVS